MSENDLRGRLIEEATRLFAERGFNRASVREIVEAAGSTKPTVYYYFQSKAGLFQAVVEHHLGGWASNMEQVLCGSGCVVDRLRTWMTKVLEAGDCHRDVMRFLIRTHIDAAEGLVPVDLTGFRDREMAAVAKAVADGIRLGELREHEIEDSVYALMGALHMRMMEVIEGTPAPPDAADRILRLYLNGVGA